MSIRQYRLLCAGCVLLGLWLSSPLAVAQVKPAAVQAEFKRWTLEADAILQAQPKSSELRSTMRLWFSDQGRSLGKVKEPILSASLPSKMWGSAAIVVDLANQNFPQLSHAEYRAGDSLVDMIKENLVAERIAIDSYRELIQYLADQDPTTSQLLKEILAVEEEHADELADLLAGMPIARA